MLCFLDLQGWQFHLPDPMRLWYYLALVLGRIFAPKTLGDPVLRAQVALPLWFQIATIWSAETGEIDPHLTFKTIEAALMIVESRSQSFFPVLKNKAHLWLKRFMTWSCTV